MAVTAEHIEKVTIEISNVVIIVLSYTVIDDIGNIMNTTCCIQSLPEHGNYFPDF